MKIYQTLSDLVCVCLVLSPSLALCLPLALPPPLNPAAEPDCRFGGMGAQAGAGARGRGTRPTPAQGPFCGGSEEAGALRAGLKAIECRPSRIAGR